MKTFRLYFTRSTIDPDWLRKVRGGFFDAVVGDDGRIDLKGEFLKFADESLPPGTQIEIWLNGHFYCASKAELEARRRAEEEQRAAEEEARRQRRQAARAKADAFNARLHLPVPWIPTIKSVLSGLSANSWGDGRNRSTVEHIMLLEDLQDGRLKRKAGDFLCTAASGDNGKQWTAPKPSMYDDGCGGSYMAAPNCTRCLELAQRYLAPEPSDEEAEEPSGPRL